MRGRFAPGGLRLHPMARKAGDHESLRTLGRRRVGTVEHPSDERGYFGASVRSLGLGDSGEVGPLVVCDAPDVPTFVLVLIRHGESLSGGLPPVQGCAILRWQATPEQRR